MTGMEKTIIDWNPPLKDNSHPHSVHLTSASIAKYSIVPTFREYLAAKDLELNTKVEEDLSDDKTSFYKETVDDVNPSSKFAASLAALLSKTRESSNEAEGAKQTSTVSKTGALWADIAASGDSIASQESPSKGGASHSKQQTAGYKCPVVVAIRVPFPQPSIFTYKDNRFYINMFKKYRNGYPTKCNPQQHKEVVRFKELKSRVNFEQDLFLKHIESVASSYEDMYKYLHPEAQAFLEGRLVKQERGVRKYCQYYMMHDSVPLTPPRYPPHIPFLHIQTLLKMGTVPKIIVPKVDPASVGQKLPLNSGDIFDKFPNTSPWNDACSNIPSCQPVSHDNNARKLSEKYLPHIVISSSGLQCLMDNQAPYFPKQWELPVEIRKTSFKEDGVVKTHHIIFIDKPLPSKLTTGREKNSRFHKYAFKAFAQHPKHQASVQLKKGAAKNPRPQTECPETVNAPDDKKKNNTNKPECPAAEAAFGDCDISDLETFGGNIMPKHSCDDQMKTKVSSAQSQVLTLAEENKSQEKANSENDLDCDLDKSHVVETCDPVYGEDQCDVSAESDEESKLFIDMAAENKSLEKANSENDLNCDLDKSHVVETCDPAYGEDRCDVSADSDEESKLFIDMASPKAQIPSENQSCSDDGLTASRGSMSLTDSSIKDLGNHGKCYSDATEATEQQFDSSDGQPEASFAAQCSESNLADLHVNDEAGSSSTLSENGAMLKESTKGSALPQPSSSACDATAKPVESAEKQLDADSNCSDCNEAITKTEFNVAASNNTPTDICDNSSNELTKSDGIKTIQQSSPTEQQFDSSDGQPEASFAAQCSESNPADLQVNDEAGSSSTLSENGAMLKESTCHEPVLSQASPQPSSSTCDDASKLVELTETELVANADSNCTESNEAITETESNVAESSKTHPDICDNSSNELTKSNGIKSIQQSSGQRFSQRLLSKRTLKESSASVTCPSQKTDESDSFGVHAKRKRRSLGSTGAVKSSDIMAAESSSVDGELVAKEEEVLSPESRVTRQRKRAASRSSDEKLMESAKSIRSSDVSLDVSGAENNSLNIFNSPETLDDHNQSSGSIKYDRKEEDKITPVPTACGTNTEPVTESSQHRPGSYGEASCAQSTNMEDSPLKARSSDGLDSDSHKGASSFGSHATPQSVHDGAVSEKERCTSKTNVHNMQKKVVNKETGFHDPLEAIMDEQKKFLMKPDKSTAVPPLQRSNVKGQGHNSQAQQNLVWKSPEWNMVENPDDYCEPAPNTNVNYDLWQLGDLRLMIRCKYHGVYNPSKKQTCFVHLTPKLEYQPQYGAEQVTYSEAARNWTAAAVRQNCRILRARMNAISSEIHSVENLNLDRLLQENALFHLEAGRYLLSHTPGNAHVQIKKSTASKRGVYDLHLAFAGGSASDIRECDQIPWIPIDPNVMTAFHHKNKRVPATFEPKDSKLWHTKNYATNKNLQKWKSKKKKKGKNKVVKS